jgi:hypothetical protein
MSEALSRLFACDRYVRLFPQGMPVRACLRRQLERRKRADGKGWEAVHPFCAGECALGKEQLAALPSGIAWTCTACGAAVIAAPACEVCLEKRSLKEVQPRSAAKAPPQDRLWKQGAVPNTPIAPPPATSPFSGYRLPPAMPGSTTDAELAAKAARRNREQAAAPRVEQTVQAATAGRTPCDQPGESPGASPAPIASANPEPPAASAPAEETAMSEKRCSRCKKELRVDNTSGVCGDRAACARRASNGKPPPLPPAPPKAKVRILPRVRVAARAASAAGAYEAKPLAELLDLKRKVDAAIERKIAAREAAIKAEQEELRAAREALEGTKAA